MSAVVTAALSLLVLIASSVSAAATDSSFPDIQRILQEEKLVVAILAADAPPMIMTNEEGVPVGFEVDLARDIGKKLGVAVEFVRTAGSYDAVALMVARGEADVAVSFLSRSVERAKKVFFTVPYIVQSAQLIYNRVAWAKLRAKYRWLEEIRQIPNSKAAATVEFGVLEGSVYEENAERDFPGIRLRVYESFPEMITAVRAGEILGAYHGEIRIGYQMRQHPEYAIYIGVQPAIRNVSSDISIAVRPDAPNLLRWLNLYLGSHVGVLDAQEVIKRYEDSQASQQRKQREKKSE